MIELSSTLVDTPIKGLEHEVTWRDTTNYAAAVGDANPRYLDDKRPGGLVAPPLFAAAVTWPVMANFNHQLGGAIPQQVIPTVVHASDHLQFHRTVRPADLLRVGGRVVAVYPGSAGTRVVLRIEVTDAGGSPVFTEYAGAVARGVGCSDAGRGRDQLPVHPRWSEPDQPVWALKIPVPRWAPFLYDGCTGISFPIHTSVAFARSTGHPDIILQGSATLAYVARELLEREVDGDPQRLREIGCRFTGVVIPGHPVRLELLRRGREGRDTVVSFRVLDEQGRSVVRWGFARFG